MQFSSVLRFIIIANILLCTSLSLHAELLIHNLHLQMRQEELNNFLRWQSFSKKAYDAEWVENGNAVAVKINYKGHTTSLFPKRGFTIKVDEKKSEQLPLWLGRTAAINLNPMFTDKSYLREYLAWEIFSNLNGLGTKTLGYVKIYLNNVYLGLYLALEPINKGFLKSRNLEISKVTDFSKFIKMIIRKT